MKKSLLVRLAFLLLTVSTLSSCIWWVDDEGHGRGGGRGGGREGDRGEHHEGHGDRR
jgi:hypothetical protein